MLKEGWDVTNLYTIVPLRAANARVLIEQTIGRGLRLPYGKRTGVSAVDRLSIVAHDKFQEIVDAANQPDSVIQLRVDRARSGGAGAETAHGGLAADDRDDAGHQAGPRLGDDRGGRERSSRRLRDAGGRPRSPDWPSRRSGSCAEPWVGADTWYVATPEVRARVVREVEAQYQAGQLGLAA